MSDIAEVLNGGRRPGEATQDLLWSSFKDVALFAVLKAFLQNVEDKESLKADLLDKWEEQCRRDCSRTLEGLRNEISQPGFAEQIGTEELPDLVKIESEFDIHIAQVKGMVVRVLDLM